MFTRKDILQNRLINPFVKLSRGEYLLKEDCDIFYAKCSPMHMSKNVSEFG